MLCTTKLVGFKPSVLSLCFVLLSACSSGGGKNKNNPPPPADTTPDEFTLNVIDGIDPTKAALNTAITLKPIKINGITAPAAISIAGGTYSINGATPTNVAGTVTNDQTITITTQSKTKTSQVQTVVLTVGGLSKNITITTLPDTTPPEVNILFPPPAFMSDGDTVLVRGTIKDVDGFLDANTISIVAAGTNVEGAAFVKILGPSDITVTLNPTKDEATFEAKKVPLTAGDKQTFTVIGKNVANITNDKNIFTYKKVTDIEKEYFPNNDLPMAYPLKVDVGMFDNKLTAFIAESDPQQPAIYGVNLNSGERSIIADNGSEQDEALKFISPEGVDYIGDNRLIVADGYRAIFEVNIINGNRTRLGAIANDGSSYVQIPRAALLQKADDKEQIIMADAGRIYSIDLPSLKQTIISSTDSNNEAIPNADNPFSTLWSIMDYGRQYLVADKRNIFLVNKADGARIKVTNASTDIVQTFHEIVKSGLNDDIYYLRGYPDSSVRKLNIVTAAEVDVSKKDDEKSNGVLEVRGMATYPGLGYMLLSDYSHRALFAMDYVTGERVVISKSYTPPVVTE